MHNKLRDLLFIRKTAKSISRMSLLMRGTVIIIIVLTSVTAVTYTTAYFYDETGNFTVNLKKTDFTQVGLSLSETSEGGKMSSQLVASPIENIDNIAGEWIPPDVDSIDGAHNGENYLAYTFYLKNAGQEIVNLKSSINIESVAKGVDEAIRIRVYKNGAPENYAKLRDDGQGPESGTTPFLSSTIVLEEYTLAFAPGQKNKYTVVIWLEGNDPECVDNILGGMAKFSMNFSVVTKEEIPATTLPEIGAGPGKGVPKYVPKPSMVPRS